MDVGWFFPFLSEPLVVVVTLNFFGVGFVGLCFELHSSKKLKP
jgi:hypothetical protein